MIAFAVLTLGINNSDWDIIWLFQHPDRNLIFVVAATLIIIPFFLSILLAARKPFPVMTIDKAEKTIIAGYMRKGAWKRIEHQYSFSDLDVVEVLRNYEFKGQGYIGRPVVNDSYEINLHFSRDNKWLGISESTKRQKMLQLAKQISILTGTPFKEKNVTDMGNKPEDFSAEKSVEKPVQSQFGQGDLPLFLLDRIGDPVHSVEIHKGKLKSRGNPFAVKIGDEFGQKFLDLIMPLVSHLVNKEKYDRSLSALEFLCSDRDSDGISREGALKKMISGGWRSDDELLAKLAIVYDAQSGPIPGLSVNRDNFERYYMALKDRIKIPAVKYRIIFFEMMEKIIEQSSARIDYYNENPELLKGVQNSENYAMRFIFDIVAIVIIVFAFFIAGSLFSFTGPIIGKILTVATLIGLIVLWRRLRKKLG